TTLSGCWVLYDALKLEAAGWTRQPVPTAAVFSARADNVLSRRDGELRQVVNAQVRLLGKATEGTFSVGGKPLATVALKPGTQDIDLALPEVNRPTPVTLRLTVAGTEPTEQSVELRPVRHLTIYLLPHSHVDIGYTARQADVVDRQVDNLNRALALIAKSKDYPEGSRFRWNTEVQWGLDHWLERATPEQRATMMAAIHDGQIGLGALYGNLLTGLCRPEELLAATTFARRVGAEAGVKVEAAMISDVPGYTWGTMTALAEAGVKYFSIGPNFGDRIGTTMSWQNKPFYWRTPDGGAKVLCWVPRTGYAIGHLWGRLIPHVPEYVAGLEAEKYPYDISYLRWNVGGDNGPPDEHLADDVKAWNERYAYPKLVIATTAEAFGAFERAYGSRLPEVRGDWTPYWEDGAGSTASETGLNRLAAERLVQAEALMALDGRAIPARSVDDAWRNVLLYSEHTWGAYNSISEPDNPFAKDQWRVKQAFALDADRQSRELLSAALDTGATTIANTVEVRNTNSWPRTDLVLVPRALSAAGDRVVDDAGQTVPSQRLRSGELAFVAEAVPALGMRRYEIQAGAAGGGSAQASADSLTSRLVSVRLDPRTGDLVSLKCAGSAEELVDTRGGLGLNSYRYLLGANPADAQANGPATLRVGESGPLVVSLVAESGAPGCRKLTREVRLVDGLDRVELLNTIDKLPERRKEGVHLGFPLAVPDGQIRLDMPLTVIRPEADQIMGSCRNWMAIGRWADVSNADRGVTLATLDAPLFEIGGITANLLGSQTNPAAWRAKIEPTQTLWCWALNNHWHTNYKADQEGPLPFRFVLRPHAAYSAVEAQRFGIAQSQPLLVTAASGAVRRPLLSVGSPDVMVSLLKPAHDGRGIIVRLWGCSGKTAKPKLTWADPQPTALYRSDLAEAATELLDEAPPVPGWGVVTLRAEWGEPRPGALPTGRTRDAGAPHSTLW
ncbi:MAG: hypothetical protein HZB16_15965, partial [Armatimonadetes bacterium]|nr:hypothetical protein [Armatimonadota bacterium]